MKQNEKTAERMNWLFYASFFLPFVGLGLVLLGLIIRQHENSTQLGIWCSIVGWITFFASYVLRRWVKRWFRRKQGE